MDRLERRLRSYWEEDLQVSKNHDWFEPIESQASVLLY